MTDALFIWLLLLYPLVFPLLWVFKVFRNRHPLTASEVQELARKRQKTRFLSQFSFSKDYLPADADEKRAMKSDGEFVACDVPYFEAPARIAGLLKYKKHEWIVVAFIHDHRVRKLWWNKGPDGTKVRLLLREHALREAISSHRPDSIAILHNHPSSTLGIFNQINSAPSEADLRSADFYDRAFSPHGIALLEFICDRGRPHLYYASFDDRLFPVRPIISEIQDSNGKGIMANYRLRMEFKLKTVVDKVAGGARAPSR